VLGTIGESVRELSKSLVREATVEVGEGKAGGVVEGA